MENVREGFNRFCSRHGIKTHNGTLRGIEGCEIRTIDLKKRKKKIIVNVKVPFTPERFYMLIGFTMRAFDIPYKDVLVEISDLSLTLPGFNYKECKKAVEWCNKHSLKDVMMRFR